MERNIIDRLRNDWAIDGISKMEMWCPVPHYEKLNIRYVLSLLPSCIMFNEKTSRLLLYLEDRKRNNEKYKEFWNDTSNVIFNDDKSEYLYWSYTKDSKME